MNAYQATQIPQLNDGAKMLRDEWLQRLDDLIETVDGWVPRDHLHEVRQIATDIDRAVAGFVRGQGTVCLILGVFYAIGLTVVGLNFGLLIGLFVGLISFIPYVGSLIGLVLSLGVALVQFWPEWQWVVAVAVIFFTGQFFEGKIGRAHV